MPLGGLIAQSTESAPVVYWPSQSWEAQTPAAAGLDQAKLHRARDYALSHKSTSFLVVRSGRIVLEAYGSGGGAGVARRIASATKSMTSILVGMAIDQGKLKLDQPVADFLPDWKDTRKEKITIRHLLSMTSGLDPARAQRLPDGDQFVVNASMPVKSAAGASWQYNTPAYHMLFRILEKATGSSLDTWTKEQMLAPLGMQATAWYSRPAGEVTNYFNVRCTARDMARFGLFVLRGGCWGEDRLVSESFFKAATTSSQELNPAYGLLFWLNARKGHSAGGRKVDYRFPGAPRDLVACLGKGGQQILVIPSQDLVIVRQGERPGDEGLAQRLVRIVLSAIEGGEFPDEPAGAARQSPADLLARMDSDANGKVSQEEFEKAGFARRRPRLFARIDANADGELSLEEIKEFSARRRR